MFYKYLTINNRYLIKRYSHIKRFKIAINLLNFHKNDVFIDYGTQDGYLISEILKKTIQPKIIVGYEPVSLEFEDLKKTLDKKNYNNIFLTKKLNLLPVKISNFTKISCLEVLEHLSSFEQDKILKEIFELMDTKGNLIISVPIEVGIGGFLKNILRSLIGQSHEGSSMKNIFKSLFGIKIIREKNKFINSHIGFNHNDLEKLFAVNNLKIYKKVYSPFIFFGSYLNSQVFYVLHKVMKTISVNKKG